MITKMERCYRYTDPHNTTFIWCRKKCVETHSRWYLLVLDDLDAYPDDFNYCPYCGSKLLNKNEINGDKDD